MPDIYCAACRKSTQHKVIMKRCEPQSVESLTGKMVSFTQLMAKFVSGEHYYEMELNTTAVVVIIVQLERLFHILHGIHRPHSNSE